MSEPDRTEQVGQPWWFEDFEAGQCLLTRSRTVTEADIAQFAALTLDTNPMRTDRDFARSSRFGGVIGHGLMGVSFAMGIASGLGIFEGSSIALLGIYEWTFTASLVVGMTVRCDI